MTEEFTPTPEQQTIIAAARDTTDNLLISALAGAAKTSTLVLIAKTLRNTPMLCLAFNKAIQVEMTERLPSTAVALTLNSLGARTWTKQTGRRIPLNKSKVYDLVKLHIDTKLKKGEKDEALESMGELIRSIGSGKTAGYVPTGTFEHAKPLMNDDEFFDWLDDIPTALGESIIRDVTVDSIHDAFHVCLDFNDQIFMPTIFPAQFPQYPVVLVDEAQDLSALNHTMLAQIAKKRLIAVGDECQAIYGFRGAHENSMELLHEKFDMLQYELTVSFRCPVAVVEEARWRAPAMQYPDWATPGSIRHLSSWDAETIPDNSFVLCRNNAPLFTLAMRLLRSGRFPTLRGNEIGKLLLKDMRKFGASKMPKAELYKEIAAWELKKQKKSRSPAQITDKANCMRVFAANGKTLGDAIAYGEHLINSSGPIHLMTGHKAKGLEKDNVFILDKFLLAPHGQDRNLLYVMQTRSQRALTYINSADFIEDEVAEETLLEAAHPGHGQD